MDAPRRWQVASLATAVAGLGLGSLMVGRSPTVEVEPIDLDTVAVSSSADVPTFRLPVPDPPEIVTPLVREDQVSPADAAGAVASGDDASPDEPVTSTSRGSSEAPAPAPAAPASPAEPTDDERDEPDSVDEPDEADEPDSVDEPDEADEPEDD